MRTENAADDVFMLLERRKKFCKRNSPFDLQQLTMIELWMFELLWMDELLNSIGTKKLYAIREFKKVSLRIFITVFCKISRIKLDR